MPSSWNRDARARAAAGSQSVWDWRSTGEIIDRAFFLAAISRWTKEDTLRFCPKAAKAEIVYYGGSIASGSGRMPGGIPRPYLFCAARLAEYKGADLLVFAFSRVVEKFPELHLILAGEDYSSGGLQRFVRALGLEKKVLWLGVLPNAQVRALQKNCLFAVAPSRRESLGISAIEAMQAGKAVIAARTGGLPEILRDGREGLLVEPKNPEALARAMLRLASDGRLRERLEKNALQRSALFGWERAFRRYARVYSSHPEGKSKTVGFVVWARKGDAAAAAYAENARIGLRRLGFKPRIFFKGEIGRMRLARAEGLGLWHLVLLSYRGLKPLKGFVVGGPTRPIVTLS